MSISELKFFVYGAVLCLLAVWVTCARAQENAGSSKSEQVFSAMLLNTQSLNTIEASIQMSVYFNNEEYPSKGKYLEQRLADPPPGDFQRSMYRLDLNFEMKAPSTPGSEPNRLTIVCHPRKDGPIGRIWKYTSIEGTKSMTYVNISKLEDAVRNSQGGPISSSIASTPYIGGLAGTMRQIGRTYTFVGDPQGAMVEGKEKNAVWKLVGSIQPALIDQFAPAFGGKSPEENNPSGLPTEVEVYIGKENAFPYKIEYWNRPNAGSSKRTLLTRIVYNDISLNGEPISEFKFSTFDNNELPEGVLSPEDHTQTVLQSLGLN